MTKNYQYDPHQRIWATSSASTLSYSDGDESEEYLFSVITNAKDVSTNSPELASAIKDWPSEYHLSPVRHNLVRPLTFVASNHILELGCGCGAMTRYFGETGATVVAVEGSLRRAMITAQRCRDLPNVSVYCDNLIDFQAERKFDFVTLIGVLEYANQFISGSDPVQACLEKAGSLLVNAGALVIAIENQLGLKYFNGCNEDHLGIPYFGINGLYRKDGPVTFGRHALTAKLNEAGLSVFEFFYPFPDYKLPGLILSEAALCDSRLNVADLLIHQTGRNYPESRHRAFAEDLAWRVAAENRLVADLANSFLVVARRDVIQVKTLHWLAKMYSRGRRRPCFQVQTSFELNVSNEIVVRKSIVNTNATQSEGDWLSHVVKNGSYIPGRLLISEIHQAMALSAGIDVITSCFKPWITFLQARLTNDDGQIVLPGNFIDCVPSNMMTCLDGSMHYIDDEWMSTTPIPMAWVVIRGIIYSIIGCMDNKALNLITYRQLIFAVTECANLHFSEVDFFNAAKWEEKLVNRCHLDAASTPSLVMLYDEPLCLMFRLSDATVLQPKLAAAEAEIFRIKGTTSWRITAPLRAVWNVWKRLRVLRKIADKNGG